MVDMRRQAAENRDILVFFQSSLAASVGLMFDTRGQQELAVLLGRGAK